MDGFYLVLLGILVLLVLGGGLLRKLFKKADIEFDDNQLDAITVAVADAVTQVEKLDKARVASGGNPMTPEERIKIATGLAKDFAEVAGISQVKVEVLIKLLNTSLNK